MKSNINYFQGIVVSAKANYFNVDIDISELNSSHFECKPKRILCTIRSKLKHSGQNVYVGDLVLVESIDWDNNKGVVFQVKERKNLLNRPPLANVTNLYVLLSVAEPAFSFDQATRFLLTAEKSDLNTSLILTKIDLISLDKLNQIIDKLHNWCYKPIPISIKNGNGIDSLFKKLKSSNLSVLCGPSGVGKSSLINTLIPNQSIYISEVSRKLKRGRHTTRNVELYSINEKSLIADTPGFNRPELEIDPQKLASLFPEVRLQLKNKSCKFRNCLHRDEPGCAIDKNWERYLFYRKCIDEMLNLPHYSTQED